jgi:hypothetical protein
MSDSTPAPPLRIPLDDIVKGTSHFPAFRVLPPNYIDRDEPPVKMANLQPLIESLVFSGGDTGGRPRISWNFRTKDGTIASGWWTRSLMVPSPNGGLTRCEPVVQVVFSRVTKCDIERCMSCRTEGLGCQISLHPVESYKVYQKPAIVVNVGLTRTRPFRCRASDELIAAASLKRTSVSTSNHDVKACSEVQEVQTRNGRQFIVSCAEGRTSNSGVDDRRNDFVFSIACYDSPTKPLGGRRDLVTCLSTWANGPSVQIFYGSAASMASSQLDTLTDELSIIQTVIHYLLPMEFCVGKRENAAI